MNKIKTLEELSKICAELKKQGKTIGLITGCFDILHIAHIELFRFAKKYVDILVIGLDNDESIKISKGEMQPLFNFKQRSLILSELESIDYIFQIEKVINFDSNEADLAHEEIIKKVRPLALITCVRADKYWQKKKRRAEMFDISFIDYKNKKSSSSSKIIQILEKEL